MGDQNVTFIIGKLTLEDVACVYRITKPCDLILSSASLHLGGTCTFMIHCPEVVCELPAGQGALSAGREKSLELCAPYLQVVIQISRFCWGGDWHGGKGEGEPGISPSRSLLRMKWTRRVPPTYTA